MDIILKHQVLNQVKTMYFCIYVLFNEAIEEINANGNLKLFENSFC